MYKAKDDVNNYAQNQSHLNRYMKYMMDYNAKLVQSVDSNRKAHSCCYSIHYKSASFAELLFELGEKLQVSEETALSALDTFGAFMNKHICELHDLVHPIPSSQSLKGGVDASEQTEYCVQNQCVDSRVTSDFIGEQSTREPATNIAWNDVVKRIERQTVLRMLSCLQIASKWNDMSRIVDASRVHAVATHLGYKYSLADTNASERRVLTTLNYELAQRSILDYADLCLLAIRTHFPSEYEQLKAAALILLDDDPQDSTGQSQRDEARSKWRLNAQGDEDQLPIGTTAERDDEDAKRTNEGEGDAFRDLCVALLKRYCVVRCNVFETLYGTTIAKMNAYAETPNSQSSVASAGQSHNKAYFTKLVDADLLLQATALVIASCRLVDEPLTLSFANQVLEKLESLELCTSSEVEDLLNSILCAFGTDWNSINEAS